LQKKKNSRHNVGKEIEKLRESNRANQGQTPIHGNTD